MKVIAIMQARLGATRLPNKVLLPLRGGTALSYELERVKKSKLIDEVVVATTTSPNDQKLIEYLDSIGQPYFAGSEQDVLDRYYRTAEHYCEDDTDVIVRLTADCPLTDPKIIDQVVSTYLDNGHDFVSNSLEPYSFPDGMDVEVFSYKNLKKAWKEATLPSHREHVTFYFWQNPEIFKIFYVQNPQNLTGYRMTLDYPEDYELIKKVCQHFEEQNNSDFGMEEIIAFLDQRPDIKNLNAIRIQNSGWSSALEKDKKFLEDKKE